MSPSPIRRRRVAALLVGLVLGGGLLAGCAGQQAPGNYGAKVEADFLKGCTTTAGSDRATFDAKTYCQCVYDELSGPQGVAFDEFKKVNDAQVEDPAPLPRSFTKVFARCTPGTSGAAQDTTTTTGG